MQFAITIPTVLGLAFDIETSAKWPFFQPAECDLGSGHRLFGDLRLEGFAALLRLGFAELAFFNQAPLPLKKNVGQSRDKRGFHLLG